MYESGPFASLIRYKSIEECSTACILRVFEQDNYSNSKTVTFVENKSVSPVSTPKPKNFSQVLPSGHYWVTSLQIEGYQPPQLPRIGGEMLGMQGLAGDARVANDGIAYHCPNNMYFGGSIDVNLVRPKIQLLNEMELFQRYFSSIHARIRYSDKGNYVVDTLRRFGGLEATGSFIKDGSTRSILDKFTSAVPEDDGSVIFLTNDQRAYLSLDAFENCLGNVERAAALVDELIGKTLISRGYIFQCTLCRLASWYSIDVLTSEFTCSRCAFQQQFTQAHWKQPVQPHWYYKLAETVYQFYKNDSHLTVQTLYHLKGRSKVAFHFVPEIDIFDFPSVGEKREIDVACISDGKIVIGECKTGLLRTRDINRLESLAKTIPKFPDSIVFSTELPAVSAEILARIAKVRNSEVLIFDDMYNA